MTIAMILAAGKSSRLRETISDITGPGIKRIAEHSQKGMVPIHDRPFLDYQLRNIVEAGYSDVCFVINNENGHEIRSRYGKNHDGIEIRYAVQNEPRGQAHAMLSARDVIGDSSFMVTNSDNLYSSHVLRMLEDAEENEWGTIAFDAEGLMPGEDREGVIESIRSWSVLEITDKEGLYVVKRHEKHPDPERFEYRGRILVDMTCGLYRSDFFGIAAEINEMIRNGKLPQQEMYSAIVQNAALDKGIPIRAHYANEDVLDLTTASDIEMLERRLDPILAVFSPGVPALGASQEECWCLVA